MKNLAFGYVSVDLSKEDLKNKKLYIEVAKTKYAAKLQSKSLNQKTLVNLNANTQYEQQSLSTNSN